MGKIFSWMFIFWSILIVNCGAANVVLQWDSNTEPDLAGYKLYYDVDEGAPYTGTEAGEGKSPIEISLDDLADKNEPEFTVTGLDDTKKYYFTVTAFDDEDLESDYSNEVVTADIIPPVITLIGLPTIVLERFSEYTDLGATAIDNIDGDITNRIIATNNLNTANVGNYTYTYTVTDDEGNTSTIVRNISVVDTTPPKIPVTLRCE